MNVTSLHFVLFTALALGVYYFLPRRPQNIWLLYVSYLFLVTWSWQFAVVLGAVTAINFLIALRLRIHEQGQRGLLWVGIGINIVALLYFRAAGFFLPQLLALFGIPTQAGGLQILIPLGLSYYVLQAISYLVDVYRGQLKAEPNFTHCGPHRACADLPAEACWTPRRRQSGACPKCNFDLHRHDAQTSHCRPVDCSLVDRCF
jgi:D-alanyl-lipoteichoic acid acyltransferase DltB (MBOAT superfamily)